ncbi:5-oxoprolinase/urea amidolyase family protein [Paeniglutamicibacter psychrophenolicus]|uniref:KipI family sensor histidine kinase inhibitor n=1 Tax=Paeniglutamicibacter psychrophenolicus TaxID=257454 RepID=A0ABS4WB30_9MICC|nr:carboxyltransferase domain-containing protein [Paeniglutamicibacter psychrophenolicus]MBP2373409.1 KipI family sensor histidine kinase inhibitor [Paeniglutamicibacter psychrophenolicus]
MSVSGVRFAGTRSVLVELSDLDSVLALSALLKATPLPGQVDVLAAASTLFIKADCAANARAIAGTVRSLELGSAPANAGSLVEVPVHYDGEDLAEVAELTGLSVEGVINAHSSQTWRAAFGGFAPGFAYLLGENQQLHVPRRATPRKVVPSGAVALAGDYSAVYPRQSPGGWQLVGHTDAVLWDLDRANPALIRPQDRVRFVPSRTSLSLGTRPEPAASPAPVAGNLLEVINPGLQSLIQDSGRPGYGDLGVSAAGFADSGSATQANRLVGNRPGNAVIENLMGRITLRAHGDAVLAVSGAGARIHIDPVDGDDFHTEREIPMDTPFALLDGEVLKLTPARNGLRSYLAVRGGIDVPTVLGSRSTDSMSGIGPAPLAAGTLLPVGAIHGAHVVGNPEPSTLPVPDAHGVYTLRVVAGPRDDWFGDAGLDRLTGQTWKVSPDTNRVGVRLALGEDAAPLERIRTGELASEGVAVGSLQVPPSGLPVLFLADHPVTGGYPVIAGVIAEDIGAAAQLPPGSSIRFELLTAPATGTPTDEGNLA